MRDTQNYIFLDLEMNQPSDKIIQVGVVIASYSDYLLSYNDKIKMYKWYIDPNEPISQDIINLTGITDEDIKTKSVSVETLYDELNKLILENDTYEIPITWGGGDTYKLTKLFNDNGLTFRGFSRRWIDVKTIYQFHQICDGKSPQGGLGNAMKTLSKNKLTFMGTPHRADEDAFNTMRFFFWMISKNLSVKNHLHMGIDLI